MALTRYEPWGLFDQLRREMERMSEQGGAEGTATSDWVPAVDVKEDQDCFVITADLPGVDPNGIEVHTENGMLTIKGERLSEMREAREGYKRMERARGTFYRRFNLPDTADTDKISAKSAHGVLEITIPKHEKLQPRRIAVEG